MNIITEGRGTQFDPNIVDILPNVADAFKQVEEAHRD